MRQTKVATERGCPVCGQRIDVVDGTFVLHRVRPEEPFADECWGSKKNAEWRSSPAPLAGSEMEGGTARDSGRSAERTTSVPAPPSIAGVYAIGLFRIGWRDGVKVLHPAGEERRMSAQPLCECGHPMRDHDRAGCLVGRNDEGGCECMVQPLRESP